MVVKPYSRLHLPRYRRKRNETKGITASSNSSRHIHLISSHTETSHRKSFNHSQIQRQDRHPSIAEANGQILKTYKTIPPVAARVDAASLGYLQANPHVAYIDIAEDLGTPGFDNFFGHGLIGAEGVGKQNPQLALLFSFHLPLEVAQKRLKSAMFK
jgi:hypothetical protein